MFYRIQDNLDVAQEKLDGLRQQFDKIKQVIIAMLKPYMPDTTGSAARLNELRARVSKSIEGVDTAVLVQRLKDLKANASTKITDSMAQIDKDALMQRLDTVKNETVVHLGQAKQVVGFAMLPMLPELASRSKNLTSLHDKFSDAVSNAVIALLVGICALAALTALSLAFSGVATVASAAQGLSDLMLALWTSFPTLFVGAAAATAYVGKPYVQLKIAQVEERDNVVFRHLVEDAIRARLKLERVVRPVVVRFVEEVTNEVDADKKVELAAQPEPTVESNEAEAPAEEQKLTEDVTEEVLAPASAAVAATTNTDSDDEWETDLDETAKKKGPRLSAGSM
jgi:hypothetical protein